MQPGHWEGHFPSLSFSLSLSCLFLNRPPPPFFSIGNVDSGLKQPRFTRPILFYEDLTKIESTISLDLIDMIDSRVSLNWWRVSK